MRIEERPRERALQYGIDSLSNRELLAIIIKSGYSGVSVLDMVDSLLEKYDLKAISQLSYPELMKIKGLKQAKALELMACFELSKRLLKEECQFKNIITNRCDLITWLKHEIGMKQQEHFMAIYLDTQNRMIRYKILFVGTLNTSIVHPREIFKEAVSCSAAKVIAVHNHPSGQCIPSQKDIELTRLLVKAGELMGIPLVDHIIVGNYDDESIMHYL